ncbi:MAG: hypothetical protein AAF468_00775 [Pseudomonadota bacterium]
MKFSLVRMWSVALILAISNALSAFAQTADDVKNDVLSALATPLPVTVIGPLVAQDVNVEPRGDGFRVTLNSPFLMGLVPISEISFTMTPTDRDGVYRVNEYTLPGRLDIMNAVDLAIASTDFDGLWSTKTRSYEKLNFTLNGVTVLPKDAVNGSINLQSIGLSVDKQGTEGVNESRFALALSGLNVSGLGREDYSVEGATAELKADGQEPVDLYAVLSRFAVLSLMQQDQNALLRFAESLRARTYKAASLAVGITNLTMKGTRGRKRDKQFTASTVNALLGLTDAAPNEIGKFVISINANGVTDDGMTDLEKLNADSANFALKGEDIPIGAMLAAIGKIEAIDRGRPVQLRVSDLLAGLFDFGGLSIESSAENIVFLPQSKRDGSLTFSSFGTAFSLAGFRKREGSVGFRTAFDGVKFAPPDGIDGNALRLLQTLNPERGSYDLTISNLSDELLHKLGKDLVIASEEDLAGLIAPLIVYVLAMEPKIETKDFRFKSAEVDVTSSGAVTFFPGWALSGMPYQGSATLSMSGLDKVVAMLNDLKIGGENSSRRVAREQRTARAVGFGVIATMKALAKTDGDKLVWDFEYPEAGKAMYRVNGTALRFPNLGAYLPAFGLAGML